MGGETTRVENRGETTMGETTRGGTSWGRNVLLPYYKAIGGPVHFFLPNMCFLRTEGIDAPCFSFIKYILVLCL